MSEEDIIVNTSDLSAISDTMVYLSDYVDKMSSEVSSMNGQVQNQIDDMKTNVSNLEQEVRNFMSQLKQDTLVSNAKQTIMMTQLEYDKKYGHRDVVRRRVSGLLQSIDINSVKKNTMESVFEETIINNPDYWLAPALVALCYWFSNNKELAQAALKKAMDRDDEKTSLLFCLVHLRANRVKTAIKWLNRYLSLQDPTKMDGKIILILEALSNGVFDVEIKDILLKKFNDWNLVLNNYSEYRSVQISRWEKYFKENNTTNINIDNYVNDNVMQKEDVNNVLRYANYHMQMMEKFKTLMNDTNYTNNNQVDKIDKLLNMLVFDYEEEELRLKTEIDKCNNIIKSNGNIDNADNTNLLSYEKKDFYTHISNICFNADSLNVDLNTKKMAIAFSKDYIIEAYNKISDTSSRIDLVDLNVAVGDWNGITKNGRNELELRNSIEKHVEKKYRDDINKPLFNKLMITSIVLGLVACILTYKYWYVMLIIVLGVLIYNGINLYNNYKYRQFKINQMNDEKNARTSLLLNTICEIVDYYFVYMESVKNQDKFIEYINSLNYNNYIRTFLSNNKRNLIIGGK